jgi:hypothetical protein
VTRVLLSALLALALASAACGKYSQPIRASEHAPRGQKAPGAPAETDPNQTAQPGEEVP